MADRRPLAEADVSVEGRDFAGARRPEVAIGRAALVVAGDRELLPVGAEVDVIARIARHEAGGHVRDRPLHAVLPHADLVVVEEVELVTDPARLGGRRVDVRDDPRAEQHAELLVAGGPVREVCARAGERGLTALAELADLTRRDVQQREPLVLFVAGDRPRVRDRHDLGDRERLGVGRPGCLERVVDRRDRRAIDAGQRVGRLRIVGDDRIGKWPACLGSERACEQQGEEQRDDRRPVDPHTVGTHVTEVVMFPMRVSCGRCDPIDRMARSTEDRPT